MNRDTFLRDLRAYCKKAGLPYRFDAAHGKGGHGRVYVGDAFTTVKHGEISNVVKQGLLKQLGLPKDAF
ncbi:hypothetical protein [Brevundimonas sp.]|jgi:mRNA interferase HicA|uniref:hypothetical protein n=1 Tax=Brevundimonas sp. TaxID=1871086 RepID=UPI003566A1F2